MGQPCPLAPFSTTSTTAPKLRGSAEEPPSTRWQHFIAWAKEIAKHEGLVKRPAASGRGYWELTEKAKR
jgi:hypothetical protein